MIELQAFSKTLAPGALVLDAGVGDQVYAGMFKHLNYEAADFEQVEKRYEKPTYSCDLASIPVEDNRFDAVVFTQVMEHLPDPSRPPLRSYPTPDVPLRNGKDLELALSQQDYVADSLANQRDGNG